MQNRLSAGGIQHVHTCASCRLYPTKTAECVTGMCTYLMMQKMHGCCYPWLCCYVAFKLLKSQPPEHRMHTKNTCSINNQSMHFDLPTITWFPRLFYHTEKHFSPLNVSGFRFQGSAVQPSLSAIKSAVQLCVLNPKICDFPQYFLFYLLQHCIHTTCCTHHLSAQVQ